MATQPLSSETKFRLDRLFRSDSLVMIRDFFGMSPELWRLVEHRVLQIHAIVDANVIQAELRWRLGSRENPQARSGLEEALDAGVLVLVAPTFLNAEIEKYLPAIAAQTETTFAEAEIEWKKLQSKLYFYEPSSHVPDGYVVDPKDLPYKNASDDLGLPVYTRDIHLVKMGVPVLWVCIDMKCRDHARATSVTLGFTMGSTCSMTIGVEALRAASKGIRSLFGGFRRLSPLLQLAIAGGIAAIVIHPRSRARILELWGSICATAGEVKNPLLEEFLLVMNQIAIAQSDADRTKREIAAALPRIEKASALMHARRICVVSAGPISVEEIVRRMRRAGYVSRSKHPQAYLRRVLRKSGQFVEASPGVWGLLPRPARPTGIGQEAQDRDLPASSSIG
jgi:hypothetical protein